MIVGGELNFAESLQLTLEDEFTVFVAGSLKSVRETFNMASPAVILLDLWLHDGDGIEFFREIKNLLLQCCLLENGHFSVIIDRSFLKYAFSLPLRSCIHEKPVPFCRHYAPVPRPVRCRRQRFL